MKNIYSILSVLLCAAIMQAGAQTTATDFTAADCDGQSHNLFTQLDSGKVAVLIWVMPCVSCVGPAKNAFSVVQSFEATHPGKVVYYMMDDYADTDCGDLNSWAAANNVTPTATFSDASISMDAYGTHGMPKVVVTGGPGHTVFFNKNNSLAGNSAQIEAAINTAFSAIASVSVMAPGVQTASLYPNPASKNVTVNYELTTETDISVEVTNITGQVMLSVKLEKQTAGSHKYQLDINDLPAGIYCVAINGYSMKLSVLE